MKVSVIGAGNVGVAIAADLSFQGHCVHLIKTSSVKSKGFDLLLENKNRVFLKENKVYTETAIASVSKDLSFVEKSDVIIVTIFSGYRRISCLALSSILIRFQTWTICMGIFVNRQEKVMS